MLNNRNFFLLLFSAFTVYALNLRIDVMQVDAAQYAEISWEMLTKKNFLQPTCLENPYLDKPPLLFWLSSLSFLVFGIHNFSYKLPSLLFVLLAIYSTYRFSKHYYDESIARIAAVILATAQALFLMTNDVRTDTILMGAVIFSIWQLAEFFETSRTKNLLLGSVGVALALLAKGPVGLIAVGLSILPHLIWKKKWRQIFDSRILICLFLVALLLLPMSIGLYQQHGTAGLKFYFWTQSFGRITGASEWNNHPDTFFLVHSTAWEILPWSLFFFAGWITSIVSLIKMRFVSWSRKEIISLSGFTFVLLALSLSKYQLPHYVFVVFPLASVIAAKYFNEAMNTIKPKKIFSVIQSILLIGLLLVAGFLQYAFKGTDALSLGLFILLFVICFLLVLRVKDWLIISAASIVSFNFLLSVFYFPAILKYQPENDFGRYAKANSNNANFICYQVAGNFALAFYAQQTILTLHDVEQFRKMLTEKGSLIVYTSQQGMDQLTSEKIACEVIAERYSFRVATMNSKFLNPETRNEVCNKVFLVRAETHQ